MLEGAVALSRRLQHLPDTVVEILIELRRDVIILLLLGVLFASPLIPLGLHALVHNLHLLNGLHLSQLIRRMHSLQSLHLLHHPRLHDLLQLIPHLHLVPRRDGEHLAHCLHLLDKLRGRNRGVDARRACALAQRTGRREATRMATGRLRHQMLPRVRVEAMVPWRRRGHPCGLLARLLGGRRCRRGVAHLRLCEQLLERLLRFLGLRQRQAHLHRRSSCRLGRRQSARLTLHLLWCHDGSSSALHAREAVLAQCPCAWRANGLRIVLVGHNALSTRGTQGRSILRVLQLVAPLLLVRLLNHLKKPGDADAIEEWHLEDVAHLYPAVLVDSHILLTLRASQNPRQFL
mmetsp:Transcript_23384/g.59750  ORF Transcript_23384/g.59750 Transcript_23384/m.59750 type:complete len:347 (+) Transcript_23384:1089-2129(+)